jgi:hypothetical protein
MKEGGSEINMTTVCLLGDLGRMDSYAAISGSLFDCASFLRFKGT